MKKLNNIIIAALAAIAAVGCAELEHPVFNPEGAVAPAISKIDVSDNVLAEGKVFGTVEYSAADFGVKVAAKVALYADINSDFSKEKNIAEGSNGLVTIQGEKLNNILVSAGIPAGEETTVYFRLKATMQGESSDVGGPAGVLVSEAATATAIGYDAAKEYPKVWVLGSFCSWSHATAQFLYNYEEDEVKYQGVIDFGEEHADNQFKLTGVAGWDGPGNWGIANASAAPESSEVELLDGSNDNITQYTEKRYYHFSFNKSTLVLKSDVSFDQVGIIGLGDDWDNDVVMNYDPVSGRFWADVTVAAATTFKYRLDAAWGTNWGGDLSDLSNGGDNIPIEEGNFRIYLSLGNYGAIKGTISAEDYGKEIAGPDVPDEPEVEGIKGWGIIGDFNSWGGDVAMSNVAGRWTGYVNITEKGGLKIRKDSDWAEDRGGTMSALGTEFAAAQGGANIDLEPGFYKIVYDQVDETLLINTGEVWSLIGDFNSWGGDLDLVQNGDKWECKAAQLPAGGIKIRHNHDWTLSVGGTMESLGTAFAAISENGSNINITEDGMYSIVYNTTDQTITITKLGSYWALIGAVDGANWDHDIVLTEVSAGQYVCPAVLISGDFKIRQNGDWAINRGGTFESLNTAFAVTQDGTNISGVSGRYSVTYDSAAETITVGPEIR